MSETTEAQAPQSAPNLTIADLIMVAQIFQRGASAGIFRAEELKSVGDFYDRLIKFLESAGAITRPQTAEPTVSAETVAQGE
jgi:hypothetical protein